MKRAKFMQGAAVSLACLGLLLPQSLFASSPLPVEPEPTPAANASIPAVIDVALQDGGALTGQVVDTQGGALAATPVVIHQQDQQVAATMTDAQGFFTVSGLRGGIYQVYAGEGSGTYRLWAPQTAPPVAQRSALVVSGQELVRGQGQGLRYWLTNPWVLAGLVGAAIAIPIALSNNDKDTSS